MNNNDPFLAAELEMIFSYPLQSLCFIISGILLMSGVVMMVVTTSKDKWRNRAEALIFSGSLIAAPIIISMIIAFIGSNILSYPIAHATVSLLYFAMPFIGAITGYLAWIDADKDAGEKGNG